MQAKSLMQGCRTYTIVARRKAVERVILNMRERLDDSLSLREMGKIAYLSPFHFNRVFRQITGIPPSQFLYALRLEAAKRLLLTTHLSVTDVCYEVGYNSLGTFTTRFTQLVGLSPSHLRHLAEHPTKLPLEPPDDSSMSLLEIVAPGCSVKGYIKAPSPLMKAIFVGLFPTRIPQSRPVGGTLLTRTGPYRIGPVPDGLYYVFAAAFPLTDNSLSYLLPDPSSLLVGAGQGPIIVQNGRAHLQIDITLRPMNTTDPPILIALPPLLLEHLARSTA
jgi:AraC family transcriptional regulator